MPSTEVTLKVTPHQFDLLRRGLTALDEELDDTIAEITEHEEFKAAKFSDESDMVVAWRQANADKLDIEAIRRLFR